MHQKLGVRFHSLPSLLSASFRRARYWVRRAWLATQPRAVMLLYHRVAELSSDPLLLCVAPEHFAEHLEHLRRHYRIMSLRELVSALREGRLPKRAVVITFDDGYADNLLTAKSLLERYEVPATVFVATGYLGREFWWDELEKLLLWAPQLPERLQVTVNDAVHEWRLGEWAQLPKDARNLYAQWHVALSDNPTPRHRAYRELHRLLCPLGEREQEVVLTQLGAQSGDKGSKRPNDRAMTAEEIRRLADGGLVEIGAHTITHPILATQPVETQRKEITESKRYLENILGHQVTAFSYPYGGQGDTGRDAVRLVREAGYEVACANFPLPVTWQSDLFLLPRYLVRNWDGEEFARRLRGWFDG